MSLSQQTTIDVLRRRLKDHEALEEKYEALEAENTRLQEKLLQTQFQALATMADAIQGIDSVLNDREEG